MAEIPQSSKVGWHLGLRVAWLLVFLLQLFLYSRKIQRTDFGQYSYFLFIILTFSLWWIRLPSGPSYSNEFRHPPSPVKFYTVKIASIILTIIVLLVFAFLSFVFIDRHFSSIPISALIVMHVIGLGTSVVLAALIGEYVQRTIYNRFDPQ